MLRSGSGCSADTINDGGERGREQFSPSDHEKERISDTATAASGYRADIRSRCIRRMALRRFNDLSAATYHVLQSIFARRRVAFLLTSKGWNDDIDRERGSRKIAWSSAHAQWCLFGDDAFRRDKRNYIDIYVHVLFNKRRRPWISSNANSSTHNGPLYFDVSWEKKRMGESLTITLIRASFT